MNPKKAVALVTMWLSCQLAACGGGCPTSPSSASRAQWEGQLSVRTPLPLRPTHKIPIKRDVHSFVITTDPATFADAFAKVLADPKRQFGLIRIDRPKQLVGQPFAVGQRFQGRYQLDQAFAADLKGQWKRIFGDLADDDLIQQWLCFIENQHASDYGMVTELVNAPPEGEPHMFRYQYLSGSPIAGSSTFLVAAVTDPKEQAKHCQGAETCKLSRLTQIFEYQEQSDSFAVFFATGGLNLHNGVVKSQAEQATALIPGAKIVETDLQIP